MVWPDGGRWEWRLVCECRGAGKVWPGELAVVDVERRARPDALRQVRVGDEPAPKRDQVILLRRKRRRRGGGRETSRRDEGAVVNGPVLDVGQRLIEALVSCKVVVGAARPPGLRQQQVR